MIHLGLIKSSTISCENSEQFHAWEEDESTFQIVHLLKVCATDKNLCKGSSLHGYVREHKSLAKDRFITSALISMYASCGALAKAQQAIDELPVSMRDVVMWSALIAGYVQQEQGDEALKCFDSMQREGQPPNAVTFTSALKACGLTGAIAKGEEIHEKAVCLGMLEKDLMLGTALVDMYARCGALGKGQQAFNQLPLRDVVTWTVLIAGYAHQGQAEDALKCFESMQREGHYPNLVTFICALKACGSIGAVAKGKQIHDNIVNLGMLEKSVMLKSSLVDMYVKCGALAKAQKVLSEYTLQDVSTWTALIAGYARQGQGEEALKCFDSMQHEGYFPNTVTFSTVLKACGSIRALGKGEEIHAKIVSLGMLENSSVLGSTLVDMYAKCGALSKAQQALDKLPMRDVVAWTTLIGAYTKQGQCKEALKSFKRMQHEGHLPNRVTFVCALKACGTIGAMAQGKMIHDEVVMLGLLWKDVVLGSALVGMYVNCGAVGKAYQVFDGLLVRDVVMWNALIAGLIQEKKCELALECFYTMQSEGHSPDVTTFTYALKACGIIGAVSKGEQIHGKIVCMGMLDKGIVLGSTLSDMYFKCGAFVQAQKVLGKLPMWDAITWNAVLAGCAQEGQDEEVLKCFDHMQYEGHFPDAVTFMYALKSCGNIGAVIKGQQIYDNIVKLGILEEDVMLGSTLVDMYARCGALAEAQKVFDKLVMQEVVAWTALIAGYAQHGQGEEALKCFDDMQSEGHSPNGITFICVLKACGSIGAVARGEQIHNKMVGLGMLENCIVSGSALVDMYARCASLAKAHQVFYELPVRNVVAWTALLGGYAQSGKVEEALNCFEKMQSRGVRPGSASLVCVLNACSHSGLLVQSKVCFSCMGMVYGITPDLEHYCCMVDALGRAGKLNGALLGVIEMFSDSYLPFWLALLGACHKWGDVGIGRAVFKQALTLDKNDDAAYVCMANIYMLAAVQEDAEKIQIMRSVNGEW